MTFYDFFDSVKQNPCPHCEGYGFFYENPGSVLVKLRRSDKLSQKDMAKALGISPQYLHDLEHDRRPWTHERIRQYLVLLGEWDAGD